MALSSQDSVGHPEMQILAMYSGRTKVRVRLLETSQNQARGSGILLDRDTAVLGKQRGHVHFWGGVGDSIVTEKQKGIQERRAVEQGELTGILSFLTGTITTSGHQLKEDGNRDATGAPEMRLKDAPLSEGWEALGTRLSTLGDQCLSLFLCLLSW